MILIGRQLDFTLESEIDWTKMKKKYSMAEITLCAVVRMQNPEKAVQRREAESAETEGCES